MRQLDEILGDPGTPETLSPEQIIERWKPWLDGLDRLFGDSRETQATGVVPEAPDFRSPGISYRTP